MDLVDERERPRWAEVAAVLVACGLILIALVKLDSAASGREADRAREVLAQQAQAATRPAADAPEVGTASVMTAPVVDDAPRPGDGAGPAPALLALFAGSGIIMSLAGAALLIRLPR